LLDHAAMYEPTPGLRALLQGIEIGMLATVDVDGTLRSRPVYTQAVDANGALWFYASRSSQPISHETWPLVNVVYAHPGRQRYVCVCGRISEVDDAERRREVWSDGVRAYFKDGPDDADLVLLRVDVEHVDYWDGPSNVLTRLIGFTGVMFAGDDPRLARRPPLEDPFAPEL
jgi:general stress protein 26